MGVEMGSRGVACRGEPNAKAGPASMFGIDDFDASTGAENELTHHREPKANP